MNKSIHIRLTDEEHKKLADLAQMANLSMTAYIKSIAFDNKTNHQKEYDIFRIAFHLSSFINNLKLSIDSEDEDTIHKCISELEKEIDKLWQIL